jgi:hypothetical protein
MSSPWDKKGSFHIEASLWTMTKEPFSRISLVVSNPPTHIRQQIMSKGKGGFTSHQGIITLQLLAPHSLAARCSYQSDRTVSVLMTSWSQGERKQGPVARRDGLVVRTERLKELGNCYLLP